jgi:hypothetical protein
MWPYLIGGAGGDDGHGGVICIDRPSVGNPAAALNEEAVVSEGSITLGDVAEHTPVLAVACSRCERAGRYNLDTLYSPWGWLRHPEPAAPAVQRLRKARIR